MVLPLLGLLALPAAAAAKPHFDQYAQNVQQRGDMRRFERSGLDYSDPQFGLGNAGGLAQQAAMGGLLAASQPMINQAFGQQQADAANATSLERARISAGPAYARLAMDREASQRALAQAQQRDETLVGLGMPEIYTKLPPLRDNWVQNYTGNSRDILNAGKSNEQIAAEALSESLAVEAERTANEAAIMQNEMLMGQMQNPPPEPFVPVVPMSSQEQGDILDTLQSAPDSLSVLDNAIAFVGPNTSRWDRIVNDNAEREALIAQLQMPLQLIRRLEKAGALEDKERAELKQRVGGDLRGKERTLLADLEAARKIIHRGFARLHKRGQLSIDPRAYEELGIRAPDTLGSGHSISAEQGAKLPRAEGF
ncbi:MAG: hypothetical protein HRU31_18945 [Rhodobacteraceae bacterium]|nr:hypothetical protein [Paracoccaceae bacterium]